MRKMLLLLVVAVIALAVPAQAQLFEAIGNPIVVAGGSYQLSAPETGPRAAFMLSANIAGVKLGEFPLYFGGVGVALPTSVDSVAAQFGNFVMLSVPGVTWYPAGNEPGTLGKVCLQAGYSYILNGDAKERSGVYAAIGYGWNSPAYLRYKRQVKAAKLRGAKAGEFPPNPYDVK
jgi:hypothetical protein